MPIRADLRHLYRGKDWQAVRERIRARAGDQCERCGKPNGVPVETIVGKMLAEPGVVPYMSPGVVPYMFWRPANAKRKLSWHSWDGKISTHPAPAPEHLYVRTGRRFIMAKCGAAHLNHLAGDDREQNLSWLCDWCHFHHDLEQHRETRATRKDAGRPILVATR